MGDRFGCRRNPAQPPGVDRQCKVFRPFPPLHLDEGDSAATAGDKVDLAARGFYPAVKDAPALEPQPQGGATFRLAALRLPFGAGHQGLSAMARA